VHGWSEDVENAETGEGRQRIEIPGGGGLKRPKPKVSCSTTDE